MPNRKHQYSDIRHCCNSIPVKLQTCIATYSRKSQKLYLNQLKRDCARNLNADHCPRNHAPRLSSRQCMTPNLPLSPLSLSLASLARLSSLAHSLQPIRSLHLSSRRYRPYCPWVRSKESPSAAFWDYLRNFPLKSHSLEMNEEAFRFVWVDCEVLVSQAMYPPCTFFDMLCRGCHSRFRGLCGIGG